MDDLIAKAEAEVQRLRAAGWTQQDFARALEGLLAPAQSSTESEANGRKGIDAGKAQGVGSSSSATVPKRGTQTWRTRRSRRRRDSGTG